MFKDIDVDEACNISKCNHFDANYVYKMAVNSIRHVAEEYNEVKTVVSFKAFQLQKWSIVEATKMLEEKGFSVSAAKAKGQIKLSIVWYRNDDSHRVLLSDPYS